MAKKRLTDAQLAALRSARDYGRTGHHIKGRSASGGHTRTCVSLKRLGLLDWQNRITEAGRLAATKSPVTVGKAKAAAPTLTSMQRRILQAIKEHNLVSFTGYKARKLGFQVIPVDGGAIVRAYSSPQYFMEQRKLIERVDRPGVQGVWYRGVL